MKARIRSIMRDGLEMISLNSLLSNSKSVSAGQMEVSGPRGTNLSACSSAILSLLLLIFFAELYTVRTTARRLKLYNSGLSMSKATRICARCVKLCWIKILYLPTRTTLFVRLNLLGILPLCSAPKLFLLCLPQYSSRKNQTTPDCSLALADKVEGVPIQSTRRSTSANKLQCHYTTNTLPQAQ